MFPNEKARLMRMMDSHGIPACNEAGVKMDFTQRVTWLIEHANQQSVHPTNDGLTRADNESKPAVISG